MDDISFFVQSTIALFVIVDVIGNIPIFNSLLENFSEDERKLIIKRATSIAFLTFLTITLTGNILFDILNIEMYSFRIAGGLLLLIIAIEMLFGRKSRTSRPESLDDQGTDLTVTPLATPLLAGPGAFTTGIVFLDQAGSTPQKILLIISAFLVFQLAYLLLSKSNRIFNVLGKTGTRVVVRIMGLMILAIAIQFIIDGVTDAILNLPVQ